MPRLPPPGLMRLKRLPTGWRWKLFGGLSKGSGKTGFSAAMWWDASPVILTGC